MHGLFLWKIKEDITITNAFQKSLKQSNCKSNKIWVDKGNKFYNKSMKSWLRKNDIKMYSTHTEAKSVSAKRFISKYMTSILKSVHIDKLDGITNKYNKTYHWTIKMKPVDIKPSTYIDFSK